MLRTPYASSFYVPKLQDHIISKPMNSELKLVPDTSVIIDGRITEKLRRGEYEGATILIPEAVVSELEAQANKGKETGFNGLEELKELNELANQGRIKLVFVGRRPSLEQVKLASGGEIDAMIRAVAVEEGAKFVTSDRVQAEVARAKGLDVEYLFPEKIEFKPLLIENFFTPDTLSVHLKDRVLPMAKRGTIGKQRLVQIRDAPCTEAELRSISKELIERAKSDPDSFVELEYHGVVVLQIRSMRVAIARPPFSDGIEITAVRPVAQVSLDDYRFSKELKERLIERQRGLLVAGPPGAGKSTFAAGVAEYLQSQEFIVKTMESPRDLQVKDEITQYGPIEGNMEKTASILLLVRPDYTIYDELRKTSDFRVFADMRLAGVGMIGVVHATRAVDAIQRLIGRVELGIIPQVVDTVVFIQGGEVAKVYDIKFSVKVPHGMVEEDLARPVILISDFETGEVEYEIYSYGEQVVVMPVTEKPGKPATWRLAVREIEREVAKYASGKIKAEVLSDSKAIVYVDREDISRVLGREGRNIEAIEKKLGMHIDVRVFGEEKAGREYYVPEVEKTKKHVILGIGRISGKPVDVLLDQEYLFTATPGRKGDIRIAKDSDFAERILEDPSKVRVRPAARDK